MWARNTHCYYCCVASRVCSFSLLPFSLSHFFSHPSRTCALPPASWRPSQVLASATAVTYEIDPSKKSGEGGDFEVDCLLLVEPGDSCYLLNGNHKHDGLTRVHGTKDKPITIYGQSDKACIKGSNTQDRALQIAHDYYIVRDMCFDGRHDDDYVSTAIYVLGADKAANDGPNDVRSSVTGFQMHNNLIKNWDEECVHLRYFVTYSEISGNLIQNCGMHCFGEDDGEGKCSVGEAIYVGTALDQVKDGKVRKSLCAVGLSFRGQAPEVSARG